MTFRINTLDPRRFAPLRAFDGAALAAQRAPRVVNHSQPGFPDRIGLLDAAVGDMLLLLNHVHLGGDTPYAGSQAIYVRQHAVRAAAAVDEVPEMKLRCLLAIRAFGGDVGAGLVRLFDSSAVGFFHIHLAKHGCFATSATRA